MSDFDQVLERLLNDPSFADAIAADPDRAFAGYDLTPQERELLGSPVKSGTGGDRTVEDRISKSGVVGRVGPGVAAFATASSPTLGRSPNAVPRPTRGL